MNPLLHSHGPVFMFYKAYQAHAPKHTLQSRIDGTGAHFVISRSRGESKAQLWSKTDILAVMMPLQIMLIFLAALKSGKDSLI